MSSPPLRKLVIEWMAAAARAVSVYYQKFPVTEVRINIRFFEGHGTRSGYTRGWNGASIAMAVGSLSTASDFAEDWMMTHEMVHLAFPSVPEAHHWIEEGSATYIEPIARARAGYLTAEKVWGDLVEGLPQGLPKPDDCGLDFTPTWGRIYWGGALFCLLADIEIRKRTGNSKGLEDALRAIVAANGTIESDWPLAKALRIGDDATGVPVLNDLYEQMKAAPAPVDLKKLWKQLGVEVNLQPMELAAWLDKNNKNDFDLIVSNRGFRGDPIDILMPAFHSGGPDNQGYMNPQVDGWLDQATKETDRTKRRDLYMQVQKQVMADVVWSFMWVPVESDAMQKYVQGYDHVAFDGFRDMMAATWINK